MTMLPRIARRRSLAIALIISACVPPASQTSSTDSAKFPLVFAKDPHSFAQPAEARVNHVSLDLTPDFTTQRITGTARLAIQRSPGADSIVLDVRDLTIKRITDGRGTSLGYKVGAAQQFVGSPLAIALSTSSDTIVIEYETAPAAAAVQWLTPEQTAGKRLPFLFTQGESILTRTWVPTQDSPGIRQSYDATVHVPSGMRAVMSAEHIAPEGRPDARGLAVYRFRMVHPIPPYLLALAVGDIAFRAIGTRTGVYAEPSVVDSAAREFAEVDQMVAAAEKLYGPYRWGRYDLLVLPPSFPYGGMENPTLTFATPTVLAGDRSLVSLVAHELAHSWSGNLVTNATWDDFWLNEGFTTYLEGRIMEELRGRPYAEMHLELGRQTMQTAVADAGGLQSPDTRLHLDLAGRDPDEATGEIAYEKGAAFLQTVESVVGRQRLDAWLREYFNTFTFQPMTSERMLAFMRARLLTPEEAQRINLQEWVYSPGIPQNIVPIHSTILATVTQQVNAWKAGGPASAINSSNWSTQEWIHFLDALPDTISTGRLAELDRAFNLSARGNSEILESWLQIAIRNHYTPAFPALERFLTTQGRRKFLRPLYTELMKTDWGRTMALDIYRRARPTYHSVAVSSIDLIVHWPKQ